MDDQNWGAAEPIRQAIHDLVSKFQLHIGNPIPSQTEHDKAVADMNKQQNEQSVQNATKTFIRPDVAAKIRKQAAK